MAVRKTSGAPQNDSVAHSVPGVAPGGSSPAAEAPATIPVAPPRGPLQLLLGVIKKLNEKRNQGLGRD
jgi:hypothetical protein